MEWSIQTLARAAGTTCRTLRRYGELGLLAPSRVAQNGYRCYDEDGSSGCSASCCCATWGFRSRPSAKSSPVSGTLNPLSRCTSRCSSRSGTG
ncbi:MAG: MerR family transcriptional regulator [Naasia sp.]|nr:MerR family transcriptional regulator [Naasia sp.]